MDVLINGRRATATLTRVAGADPAANAEVSFTVPALTFYELLGLYVVCVQGATQTPQPLLTVDDGANIIAEFIGSTAAQIAASTCAYTWGVDCPPTAQIGVTPNTRSQGSIPRGLILPPGYRIRTSTIGIGANTDYGVPSLYVVAYT